MAETENGRERWQREMVENKDGKQRMAEAEREMAEAERDGQERDGRDREWQREMTERGWQRQRMAEAKRDQKVVIFFFFAMMATGRDGRWQTWAENRCQMADGKPHLVTEGPFFFFPFFR